MYGERLMDHYRNPRNQGKLKGEEAEGENPRCGDRIRVSVELEDGKVSKVRHEEEACAVCTASASIISEEVEGMGVEETLDLDGDWVEGILETELSPMRKKCGILPLSTLQKAVERTR